jgi:hypothetical protein
MIITIRTIEQEKSVKCSSFYLLVITAIAHWFLSLGLSDREKEQGVQITLWSAKSKIKPLRTEARAKDRELIQRIHERCE